MYTAHVGFSKIYLDGYVYASQEIVLTAGPGALGDLFEKPAEAFDASHFVQFTDRVQHGRLIVVVPAQTVYAYIYNTRDNAYIHQYKDLATVSPILEIFMRIIEAYSTNN